jgi:hypothetical protein
MRRLPVHPHGVRIDEGLRANPPATTESTRHLAKAIRGYLVLDPDLDSLSRRVLYGPPFGETIR